MDDKLLDVILKRLDSLEDKIDKNRAERDAKLAVVVKDEDEIKRKLWFFAGIWAAIGGIVMNFGKKIFEQVVGF